MIKIKTAQGWRAIVTSNVIPAPIESVVPMRGWKEAGYKSYVGWLRNDREHVDVSLVGCGLSIAK